MNNKITLFGISNCDTVRKARRWLDQHDIGYRFHDFRKDGLEQAVIDGWLDRCEFNTLLNRRGTTWRQLDAASQQQLEQQTDTRLLAEHPTLIKRPVLCVDDTVLVGFSETDYRDQLERHLKAANLEGNGAP